jgi:hypothetical protein
MRGRDFLDLARELAAGATEAHWRGAAGRTYYALMLEGRDALARWGYSPPGGHGVHAWVRLRFTYAADKGFKRIGDALDSLVRVRNRADYNLALLPMFRSAKRAHEAVQEAADALMLLDTIEADPARLAAAVASLPP